MTRFFGSFFFVTAVVFTAACGGDPPAPPTPAGLAPVDSILYSGKNEAFPDSGTMVVRDPTALRDVWLRATSSQPSPAPPPDIDFQAHMVVVVTAGRMTPQDRISVDSLGVMEVARPEGGTEEALVIEGRIIEGCPRVSLNAYPVQIVRVPRHDNVDFRIRRQTDQSCRGEEIAPSVEAPSPVETDPTTVPEPPRSRPEPRDRPSA